MPALYPAPQSIPLNIKEGYIFNQLTGDSIQPIINSIGDTVITGVAIPALGRIVDPSLLKRAKVVPAGEPRVVPANLNVHRIPEELTVIFIDKDSLETFTPGQDIYFPHPFVNARGDTVPTGVPVPITGKVVPCIQPQPVEALLPRMKENAIADLKYLDVGQGMNASIVRSILEDKHGNLWFATSGGGVSKYNGETFTHFSEEEGLSNKYVTSMLEDKHGNLWFGTLQSGVSMYDGENFTHFTEKEGLSHNQIRSILEDEHGNLWFGSWGGGVSRYDGKTITHYTEIEGLCYNNVLCMLLDNLGNLWIGTGGAGISRFDGETFTDFNIRGDLITHIVWSIFEDSQGSLWFGGNGGVCMYDGDSLTYFTKKEGLNGFIVTSIAEDRMGNLWFGTGVGGVSMYDGENFIQYTEKEGLSNNSVYSILEDSHANLWLGTWGGGVSLYGGESFTHFAEKDSLGINGVKSMMEDRYGNLWFGTSGKGVSMYDGKSFSQFTEKEGLGLNFVWSILEDPHGNLWFGQDGHGVSMYNGETFTHYTEDEGFTNRTIESSLTDRQGNLWFGTWGGGVIRYDGSTFTHFTEKEGLSNNTIRSILEDRRGNLWFGTEGGGVCRYDGETFTHFTEKEGLSSNKIESMLEDQYGNLWFGTDGGGAIRYNGKTFTHFTKKEGITNNSVRSVVEDNRGNIWLGTQNGLNQLVYTTEGGSGLHNLVIHNYSQEDGLKEVDFNFNLAIADSNNHVWWSCGQSITMLDLNNFNTPISPPSKLQLNRLDINEQFIDYRHLDVIERRKIEFDSVEKFNNYPINLKLPYKKNHLTFYFSAIDWAAPHKIKYSYMVEGLDKIWSNPAFEAKTDFRNLPHGTFTFKLRAIGAAQKWSKSFEYKFTIRPPWWYSWWAYLIYGFILIALIDQYRRYLLRRAKLRSAIEIERIEKEKMLELDLMKSRFFANISHEFRTPLTLLLGPIKDLLKRPESLREADRTLLKLMKRNASRLQQLINQLLDLSKLETGKLKLQVSEGDFTGFIRSIVLSFLSLAESKNINYSHELEEASFPTFFEKDKIEKIVTNLLSNALKFTHEGGIVRISLKYIQGKELRSGYFAELLVKDTGPGIPLDEQGKIFDRFYQVSASDSRNFEGSGIGLALAKELVELHRGDIHVESIAGAGSTFTVNLSVSRDQFDDVEILTGSGKETETDIPEDPDGLEFKETDLLIQSDQFNQDKNAGPVILIVEDNPDLREYISRNLISDYQILQAENGHEGLQTAKEYIPDLVICDLMMPEMDGMEMCRLLKSDHKTSHIPLIMLTAKADRDSKLESLETGADDYILKPFDAEELEVRVKNLINQRKKLRERYRKEFMADTGAQEIPPPEDEFMVRVMKCLKKNLSESEFNVEQMGRELGLSRTQLYRKILAMTDQTPGEFIRNMRLKMAARMFLEGHKNVTRVMYSVGFDTSVNFAQHFRQMFGVNPSEYIKHTAEPKK